MDRQLSAMKKINFPGMEGFSTLADLYGDDVAKVTIRNLISMRSAIPDYDTATPYPSPPKVSRLQQFSAAHRWQTEDKNKQDIKIH